MRSSLPVLTDGVISLRSPVDADAPALCAAVRASLAELTLYLPWATAAYDEAAARSWIRGEREPDEVRYLIVGDDDEVAGGCGLDQFDQLNRCANLGYWLRTDRTRRGWATRATSLLARRALTELGLERVEIVMAVENEASRRVAERVGATFEGTLRHRFLLLGVYNDAHVYSLIRPDMA